MVHVRIGHEAFVLTWDAWEARVAAGRIPPDAEVRFDAVTGDRWVRADSLEMYTSVASSSAAAFARSQADAGPPWLTALLVGAQLRVWWWAQVPALGTWMETRLSKWTSPTLEAAEVWRPLTMGLLHTSLTHLLMNMMWLGYTAYHLERALGWRNLGMLYGVSVLAGSYLSMVGAPDSPSLGASGGVFGLIAAAVVFGFARPEILPARARRVFGYALLPYLLVMFLSGALRSGVDNWAHLGGLLAGGLLATWTDPPGFERRPGWNGRWQRAVLAVAATSLAVVAVAGPHAIRLRSEATARAIAEHRPARVRLPPGPKALEVSVPAGWVTGSLAVGRGWVTPLGDRGWSARHEVLREPVTAQVLADAFLADAEDVGWTVAFDEPVPTTVGGRPGLELRGHLEADDEAVDVVWRGAVRGQHAVQTLWQTEPELAQRLAGLHDRLQAALVWPEPPSLVDARDAMARYGGRPADRRRLVEELLAVGALDEAAALAEVGEDQATSWRAWTTWLEVVRRRALAGEILPADVHAAVDAALAADLGPAVVGAAADALTAAGDEGTAEGLILLAWARSPGERSLVPRLRRLGIPRDLTPDGSPIVTRVSGTLVEIGHTPGPMTVAQARAVEQAWMYAELKALQELMLARRDGGDIVPLLARLAMPGTETVTDAAREALRTDVEAAAAGHPPAWWHEDLPEPARLLDDWPPGND